MESSSGRTHGERPKPMKGPLILVPNCLSAALRAASLRLRHAPIVAACAVFASGQTGKAAVIFDSFDPGGGFHPQNNLVAASVYRSFGSTQSTRLAAQFTVTGSDYYLDSIT